MNYVEVKLNPCSTPPAEIKKERLFPRPALSSLIGIDENSAA